MSASPFGMQSSDSPLSAPSCRSLNEPVPTVGQIGGTTPTGQRKRAACGVRRAACGKLLGALIGRNGIVLQVIERLQFLDQSLYPILAGIGRGEGDHAYNRKPEIEAGT